MKQEEMRENLAKSDFCRAYLHVQGFLTDAENEKVFRRMRNTYDWREISYPVLRINDVADKDSMLEFAIVEQQYDILKLSFLGRMKG